MTRLKSKAPVELIDLKPASTGKPPPQSLREDVKRLLGFLKEKEPVIILDTEGKAPSSVELAEWFRDFLHHSASRITFVIGPAAGLGPEIKKRADFRLKISNLTLPHQLVRLVLLEAIYRSFDILGEKRYHQ